MECNVIKRLQVFDHVREEVIFLDIDDSVSFELADGTVPDGEVIDIEEDYLLLQPHGSGADGIIIIKYEDIECIDIG